MREKEQRLNVEPDSTIKAGFQNKGSVDLGTTPTQEAEVEEKFMKMYPKSALRSAKDQKPKARQTRESTIWWDPESNEYFSL